MTLPSSVLEMQLIEQTILEESPKCEANHQAGGDVPTECGVEVTHRMWFMCDEPGEAPINVCHVIADWVVNIATGYCEDCARRIPECWHVRPI